MNCLNCNTNVESLVSFDTLTEDFIECPNCAFKMVVEYDESFDGNGDLCCSWWLEKYIE